MRARESLARPSGAHARHQPNASKASVGVGVPSTPGGGVGSLHLSTTRARARERGGGALTSTLADESRPRSARLACDRFRSLRLQIDDYRPTRERNVRTWQCRRRDVLRQFGLAIPGCDDVGIEVRVVDGMVLDHSGPRAPLPPALVQPALAARSRGRGGEGSPPLRGGRLGTHLRVRNAGDGGKREFRPFRHHSSESRSRQSAARSERCAACVMRAAAESRRRAMGTSKRRAHCLLVGECPLEVDHVAC